MSYKKILVAIGFGAAFAAGMLFDQDPSAVEIGANGPNPSGVNTGIVAPFPGKDWRNDPYYQGNAPQGGGLNEDFGPGEPMPYPPLPPPSYPRVNPLSPGSIPFEQLERIGNPVITLHVKEGSSVWETIKTQFSDGDDLFMLRSIEFLQDRIDEDPTLTVRDVDVVPPGYTFEMGGDGSGPYPVA